MMAAASISHMPAMENSSVLMGLMKFFVRNVSEEPIQFVLTRCFTYSRSATLWTVVTGAVARVHAVHTEGSKSSLCYGTAGSAGFPVLP